MNLPMPDPVSPPPLLNRPLSADMGAAVVAHLSAYCELPKTGYLAGQAVTSALLALYGDGQRTGPVNDVDVFYTGAHGNDIPWFRDDRGDGHDREVFSKKVKNYGEWSLVNNSGRGISWVTKQGHLNVIRMEGDEDLSGLVRNFDFNLVSVGVDLSIGQMSWTPAFEAFIAEPKAIVGQARSVRSFARALKKRDEMPWIEWDIPAIARHTFANDLRNMAEGITPVIHAGTQALLDRFDPEGHYPIPSQYALSEPLGIQYPEVLSQPGHVNPLGLPSVAQVVAFRDCCAEGRVEELQRIIAAGFPVAMPLAPGGGNGCDLAECNQHAEAFCLLARHGVPVTRCTAFGNGPLHRAAALGHDDFLRRVDLTLFDIDAQAKDGRTPLSLAAKFGRPSSCHILIDRGAALEGRNTDVYLHHTPFLDAIGWGQLACAQALLDRGAKAKALLADGRTAFHAMSMNNGSGYPTSAAGVHAGDFFALLQGAGVDIHQVGSEGNTPLYDAVLRGNGQLAKSFVAHGSDLRGGLQGDPFRLAVARTYEDICIFFVAVGFEVTESLKEHARDKTLGALNLTRAQALVLTLSASDLVHRLDEGPDNTEAWNFGNEVLSDLKRILSLLRGKNKSHEDDDIDWGQMPAMKSTDKENIVASWVARRRAMEAIAEFADEMLVSQRCAFQ